LDRLESEQCRICGWTSSGWLLDGHFMGDARVVAVRGFPGGKVSVTQRHEMGTL
jgi:hypothetical protein